MTDHRWVDNRHVDIKTTTKPDHANMPGPTCPNDGQEMDVKVWPFGFCTVSCWKCGQWEFGRYSVTKIKE